jgi:hypothetical protein
MRLSTPLSALALALVLAACDSERPAQVQPGETAAPEPGRPGLDVADGTTVTFLLNPVGGSGISGEVTLRPAGELLEAEVRLSGSEPDATHQGHVHSGNCAAPGGVVVPMESVFVDEEGVGVRTFSLSLPAATLMDGDHLVMYHEAGGSPGRGVACGEIPAR